MVQKTMPDSEDHYDDDTLRRFTREERAQLRALHQRQDAKFDEIAHLLATELGLSGVDAREEAEEVIETWDEEVETQNKTLVDTPLQKLLTEFFAIANDIANIRDDMVAREFGAFRGDDD
jgi:hypothetical protein